MSETKKTMLQISRKGLLIWAGLALFVAGWMFILGILVGRGTAPVTIETDKLQKELAKLKAAMASREQAEVEAKAAGQKDGGSDLDFYEALKETAPAKNYKIIGPGRDNGVKSQESRTASPQAPAPTRPEKVAEKQRPPATVDKPEPPPAPPPAPDRAQPPKPSVGRFTVQVAALREASGADRLVDRLRKKGYPAYQIRTGTDGKESWYRVRVGAFKARGEAADMLNKLKQEKLNGLIVSN